MENFYNPQPKDTMWRSKKYLDFVKTLPSIVAGSGDVTAHHVRMLGNAGTAIKPSDFWVVPLADSLHKELDQIGRETFYEKYNIDIKIEIIKTMAAYLKEISK